MTRKYLKFAAILVAVALFIGLALILSPQDAYADSPYPEPQNICIDCDPLNPGSRYFTSSALYYKGNGTFSSNSTGAIAYYNPNTGVLVLDQYDGASIMVRNSAGKELTIVVWRDNIITTNRQFGIWAEGVDLTLMTDYNDDESSLTIDCDYNSFNENGSGAAITNSWTTNNSADIIIDGNIDLHINYKAGNMPYAIRAGHDIIIQYAASVEANALFGENQDGLCAAVYANNDIIIDTTGVITFSTAARDKWAGRFPGYAAYCKNGSFKIYPGAEYVSLSSVGTNRALCNKSVSMMGIDGSGYVDLYAHTKTYTDRMYRNPEYIYTEWLPLNAFFFPDPSMRALAKYLAYSYSDWTLDYDIMSTVKSVSRSTIPEKYRDAYCLKGIDEFGLEFLEWSNGYLGEIRLPYSAGYINGELHYSSSLKDLYLDGNSLTYLDLIHQDSLETLYCGNNLLKTLDVSDCTALRALSCSNAWTYISGYDPGPVYSDYETFNTISMLDVSMCPYLESLWCYGNNLKALELGNNSNLTTLHCYSYQEPLETLNLIGCPKLQNCYQYGEIDTQAQYFDNYDYYGSGYTAWMRIDGSTEVVTSAPSKYATLKAANLTLEGKISINLKLTTTGSGMTAKLYYEKDGYNLVKTVPLNSSVWHSEDGGYYLVTYDQVPAKEMTNNLMIMVFDSAGDQVMLKTSSAWWTGYKYNVATWCNNKIAKSTNAKEVTLAKAMLNYGHYTQLALGYNDGNYGRPNRLANPKKYLATEMNNVTANNSYSAVTTGGTTLGAKAFALVLESDTSIKLKLKRKINVSVDGVSVTPQAEYDNDGSVIYCVYKNGIPAKKLHERASFKLTEGSNSATLQYGALSWANNKLAGSNENDKNLARAMYLYNSAARAYFNY